jgi:hypothetical protein
VLFEYPEHHVTLADPEGNEFCVALRMAQSPASQSPER